jgi:lipooligosaccharide transport system permease protein
MSLHVRRGIYPIFKKVVKSETDGWVAEVLSTIAVPVSFFLAFGLGLHGYIAEIEGVSYMVFITPGLVSLTILLEAYRTGAWGLWLNRWHNKMIHEFRIKPVSTSDIIIGQILGGFMMALVKGLIVGLMLFLLAPFATTWQNLGIYLLYMFPGSILFTCIGAMVGTTFRKPDQIAQSQTIVITPLLYLGGLFFPINAFPQWSIALVRWLPTTALFEGGRHAFLSGVLDGFYLGSLTIVALASFVGATLLFNRKLSE